MLLLKQLKKVCTFIMVGSLLFLSGCETDTMEPVSATNDIKVYHYDEKDLTNAIGKINALESSSVSRNAGNSDLYYIDTENVYGVVDSIGNISYSFRLYFNNMPASTFYNIVVTDRVNNDIPPFVLSYNTENSHVPTNYYALDTFLDEITAQNSSRSSISNSYSNDDDMLNFTDCGEVTEGGEGGSDSSGSGSGGTGTAGDNGSGQGNSGNGTYIGLGSYDVYTHGGGGNSGGGPTGSVIVGELEMLPVDAVRIGSKKGSGQPDDDRTICPEGEVIVVENNPLFGVDCKSFSYSAPPGALFRAAKVDNFVNRFYGAYLNSDLNFGVGFYESSWESIYFVMPLSVTNGEAANLSATAVTNAIREMDSYVVTFPQESEFEYKQKFENYLTYHMGLVGGSWQNIPPPFPIPTGEEYEMNFFGAKTNCD